MGGKEGQGKDRKGREGRKEKDVKRKKEHFAS